MIMLVHHGAGAGPLPLWIDLAVGKAAQVLSLQFVRAFGVALQRLLGAVPQRLVAGP